MEWFIWISTMLMGSMLVSYVSLRQTDFMSIITYFYMLLLLLSFLWAAYTLYLYLFSQHGMIISGVYSFGGGSIRENSQMFLHWLPFILKTDSCYYDCI